MIRITRILLGSIAVLLLLTLIGLVIINGTYFGREHVRQLALDAVRDMVNGEVVVGRIDGNLLDRFDLVDVSITDKEGRPFLVADRIRARVALSPLFSKRLVLRSLDLQRPVVTLTKNPGGRWNYQTIFDSGDTLPDNVRLGFGSWIDLHGITIRDGTLFVHQPYPGDEAPRHPVGDSAAFAAMARDTRVRVERVGASLRQTMEFRDINARIPRLIATHPDSHAVAFRIRQLSMQATPLQAPDVIVRDLRGDVRITSDTVTLRGAEVRLPSSRIEGDLTYHVSAGDVALDVKSDTLAFADIRTLYPALPERGGGRLEMTATIRDTATSEYEFRNARLGVDDSRVSGRLGMAVNPHMLELRETDLRFSRFRTALVESLFPRLRIRVPGAFTGTAKLDGPSDAMRANVNGTFYPAQHAPFQLAARGIIGTGEVTRAENLRLTVRAFPVSLARQFMKELPVGGTVNGDAVVTGSWGSQLTGRATVTHREAGAVSTLVAEGAIAPRDSMRMRLNVRLTPVSLELVERFAPGTDLRGDVRGTGDLRGTLRNLRATLALQLPAGTMDVDGTFDVASAMRGYDATVRLGEVDLHAVAPSMPATTLNGVATIAGRGVSTATMDARLTLNLTNTMVDSAQVNEAVVVARAREARLTVDTLRVRTPFGTATAAGTFGLAEGTDGTLTYAVDVNTMSGLQRWIATGDTNVVLPRTLVRQRMARADSLRLGLKPDTANIAAMASRRGGARRPAPLPEIQAPLPLGRDSIAGAFSARGTIQGRTQRFTAQGKAALNQLIWDGYEIGRGALDFTWADVRTPDATLTAELGVDSLRAAGFAFDSTHVQATYRGGSGTVALAVYPGDTAIYRLRARYALHTDHGEVHLQEVNLRFDSLAWVSTRPSTIRWRGRGLAIDSLELRSSDSSSGGRILVHGEIPDGEPGRFAIRIDSLRLAPWVTLLQSNVPIDGIATLNASIEGTRAEPRIRGSLALQQHTYRGVPFPEIHSGFTYADRRLRLDGDLRRAAGDGGAQLATLKGDLPIELSLGDAPGTRRLDGPITIDIEGDSIPLGPLAEFVEEFSAVTGEARGRIGVRGTWDRPRFDGAVAINVPRLGLRTPGVTLTNAFARVHMLDDRLVIDTLVAHSGGPARVTGSVLFAELDHPVLDLRVIADETRVLDNKKGQLVVNSLLSFKGPVDTISVAGSITVMHGVIRIPDPEEWHLISTRDPALFAVVDTALARELDVAPLPPFLTNANVDVRLQVRRGTWARSREANVEVYGDLAIERVTGDEEISVTGALHSDYGDYQLYGRTFSITRGSIRFTGSPTNPVLQLLATHDVRQPGRAPFDVQVTIGGTLKRPSVSLESQAEPTLTQSDLISFLAFGQSSTSLLQFTGSGVEGGGLSGSSLAGNVATLATRQLTGVALGALLAEWEADLAEKTAADVLSIKPAELPPGLSLGGLGAVARGTQIEIGSYLDRHTFLVGRIRPTLAVPGAMLERRFGPQFRIRTSLETRYQPQVPSLTAGLQPRMHQVLGALLFWSRGW